GRAVRERTQPQPAVPDGEAGPPLHDREGEAAALRVPATLPVHPGERVLRRGGCRQRARLRDVGVGGEVQGHGDVGLPYLAEGHAPVARRGQGPRRQGRRHHPPSMPGARRAERGPAPYTRAMAEVRIGVSGWRYAPWRGTFYPPGLAHRRELEHIAATFPTVELNGSFYSLQRPTSYERWRAETPPGFTFAVKGGRFITHFKQ